MADNYLGFDEKFVSKIKNGEKSSTLRYPSERINMLKVGMELDAITSHDRGSFAVLQITDKTPMTVEEIIQTQFNHHQNYDSIEDFNRSMSEYYEPPFDGSDEFVLIDFIVVDK